MPATSSFKPDWRRWKPVDLTEPFLLELSKRIKAGATPEIAARSLGLPLGRFRKWMRKGEEDVDRAFDTGVVGDALTWEGRLFVAVGIATGTLALELAGDIKAGSEHSREKQWLLERLEREDYGNAERIDVDVTVGGGDPIVVEGRVVALEHAVQLLAASRSGQLVGGRVVRGELPAAPGVLPDPGEDQRPPDSVPAE